MRSPLLLCFKTTAIACFLWMAAFILLTYFHTSSIYSSTTSSGSREDRDPHPNFIVFQPDDLAFYEEWMPPAHFPLTADSDLFHFLPSYPLRHMERLRSQGVQMTQAYTASPMCGTSRYSSITGRYPTRSSVCREKNAGHDLSWVSIPFTRLQDTLTVPDGLDCSQHNLAAVLLQNRYRTGMVGKWHLTTSPTAKNFDYASYKQQIVSCGFEFVEGVYVENLNKVWNDGTFSHNMEYVTMQAERFLRNQTEDERPFFLYFNPTVPHDSGDVFEALTAYECTDTPQGKLKVDPVVTGMTADYGGSCVAYRQSVLARTGLSTDQNQLGSIWVDDAVGALLAILEETRQLDNTFFLLQMDHGKEGKWTLWEPGIRHTLFLHYPAFFGTGGHQWPGLVSTVDIAPTILDLAGIEETSPGYYPMDGLSFKDGILNEEALPFWRDKRCLLFEVNYDRAIRCGCDKYMSLDVKQQGHRSPTLKKGLSKGLNASSEMLLHVCSTATQTSVIAPNGTPEGFDLKKVMPERHLQLRAMLHQHMRMTSPMNDPVVYAS